jgi:hypothetical protein
MNWIHVSIATLLVGVVTFFWRYLLTINRGNSFAPDDDSVVHYYFVKMHEAQPQRFKITKDDRFLVGDNTAYPQLFHKIIALILGYEKSISCKQWINPTLDTFFNMILFNFSNWFIFKSIPDESGLSMAFITSMLYLCSPLMIFYEARVINFGERLFSYILGMLSIIAVLIYFKENSLIFLLLAVVLNVLIIFSSQFTLQVILVFHLFASLLTKDVLPFLTVIIAFAAAFSVFPKLMIAFVKAKYKHIDWYYRALKLNQFNLAFIYRKLLRKTTVYGLAFLLLLVRSNNVIPLYRQEMFKGMIIYIIVSICIFGLVYLPVFKPFGEAIRYLEYSQPFALILLVYICTLNKDWVILGILSLINMLSTIHFIIKFNLKTSSHTDWKSLIAFLEQHQNKTLLIIPEKLSYLIATHLDNKLVAAMLTGDDYKKIDAIRKKYAYPIDDFEKINCSYPFNWILYRKGHEKSYDFSDKPIVFQNTEYIVLEN